MLDEYRRSFAGAYEHAVQVIRDRIGLQPTGRPAKSTTSIVEKLRRETIRLSQVQDIAGCRLVVPTVENQEAVLEELRRAFDDAVVIDRRRNPSHGYRAIHVIARHTGLPVEIQLRTSLQHLWAEFSEKLSDVIDPAIKYGGGDERVREPLLGISRMVEQVELMELAMATRATSASGQEAAVKPVANDLGAPEERLEDARRIAREALEDLIDVIARMRHGGNR
jgi:ppGpp synthetase/RelA/SpoT-type nucleotidyltranferase